MLGKLYVAGRAVGVRIRYFLVFSLGFVVG